MKFTPTSFRKLHKIKETALLLFISFITLLPFYSFPPFILFHFLYFLIFVLSNLFSYTVLSNSSWNLLYTQHESLYRSEDRIRRKRAHVHSYYNRIQIRDHSDRACALDRCHRNRQKKHLTERVCLDNILCGNLINVSSQ
jgi:hypothetical protein